MNNERMNSERVTFLLEYLDGLTALTANDYRCNTEIGECIGMIRDEFAKSPKDVIEYRVNGEMFTDG